MYKVFELQSSICLKNIKQAVKPLLDPKMLGIHISSRNMDARFSCFKKKKKKKKRQQFTAQSTADNTGQSTSGSKNKVQCTLVAMKLQHLGTV